MAQTIKEAARERAESVLRSYWPEGYNDPFPVDPYVIATRAGIKVFTAQLETNVSGLLTKRPFNDPEIYLDIEDSSQRRVFTCAHELGHYFDRAPTEDEAVGYVDRRDGKRDPQETFADEFAGNLLMPAAEVKRLSEAKMDRISMAAYFGVSQGAMRIRLANLQLPT